MILSVAKKFIFSKPIIWKAAAGLLVTATISFFVWDYTNTKREADRLSNEAEELFATVTQIKQRVDEQQSQINQVNQRSQQIESNIINRLNELSELRQAPVETEEEQQVVEQQLNDAFRRLNRELSCVTGNEASCQTD